MGALVEFRSQRICSNSPIAWDQHPVIFTPDEASLVDVTRLQAIVDGTLQPPSRLAGIETPQSMSVRTVDAAFRSCINRYATGLTDASIKDLAKITSLSKRDDWDIVSKEKLFADGERYWGIVESTISIWEAIAGITDGKAQRVRTFRGYQGSLSRRMYLLNISTQEVERFQQALASLEVEAGTLVQECADQRERGFLQTRDVEKLEEIQRVYKALAGSELQVRGVNLFQHITNLRGVT